MEYRLIAVGDPLSPAKGNGERAMMKINISLWMSWSRFLDTEPDPRLHLCADQIACPCRRTHPRFLMDHFGWDDGA